MRKLGIFLGFTPKQLVPHEGISRLIGFIVRGAAASGEVTIEIAAPSWLLQDIELLLADAKVPAEAVQIVTTEGKPFIVRVWEVFDRWRSKRRKLRSRRSLRTAAIENLTHLFLFWVTLPTVAGITMGAVLATVGLALIAAPAFVALILYGGLVGVRYLLRRIYHSRAGGFLKALVSTVVGLLKDAKLVDFVQDQELKRLVRMLNRRRNVEVWYVPSMFWPQVGSLKGKVVMAAPDIVFYEHPSQYISDDFSRSLERITASINAADHLICYSDYVKKNHLMLRQNVASERITVIRHGAIDTREVEAGVGDKKSALTVLNGYLVKNRDALPPYLQDFDFEDVDYIFYSSQLRYHKNIEGLIHVYERLLRVKYRPVKLVLTARIDVSPRIRQLVADLKLHNDVLSLPSVPNNVLASLYRLARLSVTPTMFEGGFPFTFTEAYSVGTPSVMSRIPVVTELITDTKLLQQMTFDPRDKEEMLNKIMWGLENRCELLEAQRPLFDAMQSRPWTTVADEYIELMKRIGSKP